MRKENPEGKRVPDCHTRPILLVEDTLSLSRLYCAYLASHPYEVTVCETGQAALSQLAKQRFSALILDLQLPDMHGLEILKYSKTLNPAPATVVITANGSVTVAVEAMREGAYDFIVKPFDAERLTVTLANALNHYHLREIVQTYQQHFERQEYHGFIGHSPQMQAIYRVIENAALSDIPVFITGESGSGKEICAEAIHRESRRKNAAFVAVNCAAIPQGLVESELFGHVKGAFTGAIAERIGAVGKADKGTLFLDEICEMPLDMQPKLLRFLQTGSFNKVGSSQVSHVDVRILCATNREPRHEIANRRFREDLFYRLHGVPIHLPPLRDRADDIMVLAERFLALANQREGKQFRGFTAEATDWMHTYSWPGNVRELENVVHTTVLLNQGDDISPDMLSSSVGNGAGNGDERGNMSPSSSPASATKPADEEAPRLSHHKQDTDSIEVPYGALADMERYIIKDVLNRSHGHVLQAAAFLQVSPSTLYRKIKTWQDILKP